jgi:hypothetical protein
VASCGVYTLKQVLALTVSDELEDWHTVERFWACLTLPSTAQEIGALVLDGLDSCHVRAPIDESDSAREFAPVLECLGIKKIEETYRRLGHIRLGRLYGSRDIAVHKIVPSGSGWTYGAVSAELHEPSPNEVGSEVIRLLQLDP